MSNAYIGFREIRILHDIACVESTGCFHSSIRYKFNFCMFLYLKKAFHISCIMSYALIENCDRNGSGQRRFTPHLVKMNSILERRLSMKYTQLGNSDLRVSRICMGCMGFGNASNGQHSWTIDEEHSREIIQRGLELGVNFFDRSVWERPFPPSSVDLRSAHSRPAFFAPLG